METTKQKAIREAYGEYFEVCKPNQDGWSYSANHQYYKFWDKHPQEKVIDRQLYFRPFELLNIENNNGWIKIESEADLPKEIEDYWVLRKNETTPRLCKWLNISVGYHTHYQPIIKPSKPIY